ncbi:hypothetical protein EVAR_84532_1 [Eumeta japonica]|uniref:Uncharacterized protein n=1 Tax=Eumeta variegata TaxID=151549 RepID=A0A4C1UHL3_EUMVA|nr:hypothetical protein EVAR_84532_1 [Eumeta japonica]
MLRDGGCAVVSILHQFRKNLPISSKGSSSRVTARKGVYDLKRSVVEMLLITRPRHVASSDSLKRKHSGEIYMPKKIHQSLRRHVSDPHRVGVSDTVRHPFLTAPCLEARGYTDGTIDYGNKLPLAFYVDGRDHRVCIINNATDVLLLDLHPSRSARTVLALSADKARLGA